MGAKIPGDSIEDGLYNPFEHREVKHPNSDLRSTANLLKGSLGSGILAMPLAMRNAGLIPGLIGTLLVGVICTHTVQMLVKTSQDACRVAKEPLLGYAETCEAAFAHGPKGLRHLSKKSRIFANFALFISYMGACCVYTVLIAESMKQIIDQLWPSFQHSTSMYCLMITPALMLVGQLKNLNYLAPLSIVANVLMVLVFSVCLYYVFSVPITFDDKEIVADPSRLPMFLSTVIFAMEGIGVVMPTENQMKHPEHFLGCPGVLMLSMVIVVALYTILGFVGYLRFGLAVAGSITLNLPVDESPAIAAKCMIILAIFLTYPLQFYVPMEITEKLIKPHVSEKNENKAMSVFRAVGVLAAVAVACSLPNLEQVMSIVGALCYSVLGVLLPAVVETVFYWDRSHHLGLLILKNVVIFTIGVTAMVSGCLAATILA